MLIVAHYFSMLRTKNYIIAFEFDKVRALLTGIL